MFYMLLFMFSFCALAFARESGTRTAHYVPSTHWDREWYESFQGFRMRLVSMLDEVFDTFEKNTEFKTFILDGQIAPVYDYLEIRPEKLELVKKYIRVGRLRVGPWYVMPDEFLVSGESLVRNLQMGVLLTSELGGLASRAGFVCDIFGHTGQMPQIFDQMGCKVSFVWRGTHEKEYKGHFNWIAPDGTVIPTYRFGRFGYCSYVFAVRNPFGDTKFDLDKGVENIVAYTLEEAKRSDVGPILLFDGGDHMEIEPQTSTLISRANEKLKSHGIEIIHSDLDDYSAELLENKERINKTLKGELRESSRDPGSVDEQWLIPGVLSSRIHLKQQNAACEDELCLWAEPFSAFSVDLGREYPVGYLRSAWKHLLENHPHDSICGCSIDQVHKDMIYRFDQSLGISSMLTSQALKAIALAATPAKTPDGSLVIAVFNPTSEDISEPIDLDIPLPTNWPKRFQEFFGFEEKFAFHIVNSRGEEIPYQLVGQQRDRKDFRRNRYKFPSGDNRHIIKVTAPLDIPAFGYTTVIVKPVDGPTRYLGSMMVSHNEIENDIFSVRAESNGTLSIYDKRTGKMFKQLLTFEDRADIGDGWYHGMAVNDRIHSSTAAAADISLIADGLYKATLRISVTMNVPVKFDFSKMVRSTRTAQLKIISDVTLRKGSDKVEVSTTVENTVLDHRLRVLFPIGLKGNTYLSDAAFNVVERPVALAEDNAIRRELDVETRPQITWTVFGDGKSGLAIVSRGLPESAVIDRPDRPIALTLLRAFRRAVFSNDNPGGQIQGSHMFRYDIVPFDKDVPVKRLFILGQRVNVPVRTIDLLPVELEASKLKGILPGDNSFLQVEGNVVVTSVQRMNEKIMVRFFNPFETKKKIRIKTSFEVKSAQSITLDGKEESRTEVKVTDDGVNVVAPGKRIVTVLIG